MTERDIRGLQLFYWTQIIGASLCLCFTLAFNSWAAKEGMYSTPSRLEVATVISWVVGLGSVALWTLAIFMFHRILSGRPPVAGFGGATLMRRAYTIRIALFQSAAILGLVALLISGVLGVLSAHPFLWLMAVPYGALIGLAIGTFPTKTMMKVLPEASL